VWRTNGLYRDTWVVFANAEAVPQTVRLVIRWDGQAPIGTARTIAVGGREAFTLEQFVPATGNWNGTVEMSCSPGTCAEVVSIYADNLKRGTVASHPQVKWRCR
jgi:hypothetical protein